MTYSVVFRSGIARETRNIPAAELKKILDAVRRYAETGYGNVIALKGRPGEYRQRVGDWRVLFAIDYSSNQLVVQHILNRREAYRD
jgi:mRNA interferase RelE/StbE